MTQSQDNFSLVRKILRALGLSLDAVDDIIDRIADCLSDSKEKDVQTEYPYSVRDDFLVCSPQTARPLLRIELDDKSHQQRERQDRDECVKQVFSAAKLPLVRIPVQHYYSVTALDELLRQQLGAKDAPHSGGSPVMPATQSVPLCQVRKRYVTANRQNWSQSGSTILGMYKVFLLSRVFEIRSVD